MFPRLESPVALEETVRQFWERERIFERSLTASEGRPAWVFYEGPPTANGTPHNGHVLTRVLKDVFPRFRTMQGHRVVRKAGWDTHGLPVEVEVERELGLHGREAILEHGLERFNRACMENVFTYIHEWDELTRDIGFWVDLKDPYVTFHKSYVESVWWALSRLFEKGLLYQGHKVVWWWPQGGTTLSAAEVGLGYRQVDDPAATVRFRDARDPTLSYLAWTTTPWTLPSNVALAVAPHVDYALCDDPEGGTVVVAADLAESLGLVARTTLKGHELVGRHYLPLYEFGPLEREGACAVIVAGHHVTTKSGSGIVHIAPAYGEDDMLVAQNEGLGMYQWVGPDGRFRAGFVEGRFCKEADRDILRDLRDRGLLFRWDTIKHDYPFCWRASEDPLIQYARPAWFVATSRFKDLALQNSDSVNWQPDHIREGRFGDFLRNNVDWALSRERFWGTPLNIWTCEACEARVAPSSLADMQARGAVGIRMDVEDHLRVHRPWIDEVTLPCADCGGTMRRVPEVIDCWFDSGAMPFAQWGFPHQGREAFADQYPADFISEAIDQTRGWFYTLLMISTLVFDDETCAEFGLDPVGLPRPYKNCLVLGHVTDRHGLKESKSKGNYTSPNLVMRGSAWQIARADSSVKPGTVGLKKAQVDALELGEQPVRLTGSREAHGNGLSLVIAPADGVGKDALHLHPDDIARLGVQAGDKVWFHMPGDIPGADAFRWLFCAASPSWSNTRLSLRAIRDGQREFLLRLRNVYQFFSIYANLARDAGTFDPAGSAPRPVSERDLLDRWITHRVETTTQVVTKELEDYRLYEASRALLDFVDDLSNWYVRRSRQRFWAEGEALQDALWTLYEVLLRTSHLLAPFVPFHADALFRALTADVGRTDVQPSVHLQPWPAVRSEHLDDALAEDMALTRRVASLGRAAREASRLKVRQPLAAATVVLADARRGEALQRLSFLISDELNVREVRLGADAAELVEIEIKPNLKTLGRRLGPKLKALATLLASSDAGKLKRELDAGSTTVVLEGEELVLTPDDVLVRVSPRAGFEAASSTEAVVALATELDADLLAEGFVRELTSRVQTLRKEADLGYADRIALRFVGSESVTASILQFGEELKGETLCVDLKGQAPDASEGWTERTWDLDGSEVRAWMQRVQRA